MQRKLPDLSEFQDYEIRAMADTVIETSRVVEDIVEKHRREGIEYVLINGNYEARRVK